MRRRFERNVTWGASWASVVRSLLTLRRSSAAMAAVCGSMLSLVCGCEATLSSPDWGTESSCDDPVHTHPRRVLRLSAAEVIGAARAWTSIDDEQLPAQLVQLERTERREAKLAVTKEFHQSVDALAGTLADQLSSLTQGCERFGEDEVCTAAVLSELEADLLRSAPDPEGRAALKDLVQQVARRSGAAAAFRMAVRALALSPKSLYLTEGIVAPDGSLTGRERSLRGKELASFLSFRLSKSSPSVELIEAVGNATVSREDLERLVDEQFGTAGLEELTQSFLEAWLRVREIGQLSRNADKHPDVDAEFLASLEAETRETLARVARQPRVDLLTLVTAPQAPGMVGDDGAGAERPGVFSLPGVLAAGSSNNHTNIPRRGRFLLKSLFCMDLPNPPPGAVNDSPPLREGASERERFEAVEKRGTCGTCHSLLNPLAFPFEVYDEIGRWRAQDEHGNTFDTTGVHETQDGAILEFEDARSLMELVAQDPTVKACVVRRVDEHVSRRELSPQGETCATSTGQEAVELHEVVRDALLNAAIAPRGD